MSSFGLGGTNAHIVLEEAPKTSTGKSIRPHQLLVLTAKDKNALDQLSEDLTKQIQDENNNIHNIAVTLQVGRQYFAHRCFVVAKNKKETAEFLQNKNPAQVFYGSAFQTPPTPVFLFPGGGAQHTNMGRQLYEEERAFKKPIDQCLTILKETHQLDLKAVLYPDHHRNEPIEEVLNAITLLFVVEYATAQLLISWGIRPTALIGHSLGEYTAACISGVLRLEDALALVVLRGQLFKTLPKGAMLSIPLSTEKVAKYMNNDLSFAAVNKPDLCVVSGSVAAIDRIKGKLNEAAIHATRLHIQVAAHSHMVEPILDSFISLLDTIQFGAMKIPIVSNLSGVFVKQEDISTSEYWANHLRDTVRFSDGIATILKLDNKVLIEVGPGQTLSTFSRQHPVKNPQQIILSALKHPKEIVSDTAFLLKMIGQLFLTGFPLDWNAFNGNHPFKRVSLPTYPFKKARHWIDPKPVDQKETTSVDNQIIIMEESGKQPIIKNSSRMSRKDLLIEKLKDLFYQLSGIQHSALNEHATFLELGFDSLFLTQATAKIKKTFKINISFRQLFEEAPTIDRLAALIDKQLDKDIFKEELNSINNAITIPTVETTTHSNDPTIPQSVQSLIERQLKIMEQQLALLSGQKNNIQQPKTPQNPSNPSNPSNQPLPQPFGPWHPIDKKHRSDLTDREIQYLDELIKRYTTKTKGSQQLTQKQRLHLADPRAIVGFNRIWKDMVYQIAVNRSKGSKMWDVDGNEYVDYRMAFGISLFGHTPDFIQKAVAEQLEKGFELGVLIPLANKVADLLCELSGMDRATLVNTGSEAVSAAVRAARTVTGKDKILVFEGDYHGIADEMLARRINRNDNFQSMPISPGIPQSAVENVIVLDYEDPDIINVIIQHADELAAVIIEPIQPNNSHKQRVELFHTIRKITLENDIALIFDEMITGFRIAPRGAQEWFAIEVDIIAYGKIISGGLPMAAVAGKSKFMDAFDGGMWQYGDDSFPEAGVTFFGGTFVKHPLSLAAAFAALSEIKKRGANLYEELNEKTKQFAERISALFTATKVPLQVLSTASIIAIKITDKNPLSRLFFYYCRLKGVHIKEKAALISTAHTSEDLDFTYHVFEESIREMQTAGFFQISVSERNIQHHIVPSPLVNNVLTKHISSGSKLEKRDIPLTEGQKEVWVEQRLGDEAAAAYNLSSAIVLKGRLDIPILQKSIQKLIDRHEALRTVFDEETTTFHVRPSSSIEVPLIDLSNFSTEEKTIELQKLRNEEVTIPLDIFKGPVFRSTIIRMEKEEHHILMTAHHGVADGWSCGVLVKDLSKIYSTLIKGEKLNLPEPKQISVYAWECNVDKKNEERTTAENYWINEFTDEIPVLDIPTDFPRPSIKTYPAACEKIAFDKPFLENLKALSNRNGTTLFVTMYTAFQTFIHRLSNQNDFVLGIVSAGQSIAGNEDLVAHGVSLLPVRILTDSEVSFTDHLKKVRGKILDAFDHQNYTLGALVKKLNLPRDLSRQPIMSVLFNMDAAVGDLHFGDIRVTMEPIPRKFETFDIFINVKLTATGIDFDWTYNTDLFKSSTINRRLEEFKTFLQSILENEHQPVCQINILPEWERKLIMEKWTATQTPFPDHLCVHELFEQQAEKKPYRIAVESQDKELSYQELNKQANQLARLLRKRGVKRGDFVAIYMQRSVELLVGLLAILKAGGIYVPLDPSNPKDRLSVIIEDADTEVIITKEKMLGKLPSGISEVIVLEREYDVLQKIDATNRSLGNDPKDMAYIIYTSGSTGRPKGVVIPHYAVVDHHLAMIDRLQFSEDDVILSVASVSFDPSVQDFFLPLFLGAKVVIASQQEVIDGYLLKERMEKSNVTMMEATPTTWQMLLMAGWKGHSGFKAANMGEGFSKELAWQLMERCGEVYNTYGPTETTIYAAARKLTPEKLKQATPTGYETIGHPINNSQIYILDKWKQPVPIGVSGEIYVGGVGVAPGGYYKRPELNKVKFVPNPFNEKETVYRTGDLARWLPDGDLEFTGRVDHQVKVRGFRIELGEIESLIAKYPGVVQNIAIVREDVKGDKRIVAYLVMEKEMVLNGMALKRYLKEKLPEYMLPSAFVQLEVFPLTGTLKINRKALPVPDYHRDELEVGFLAPSTSTEKQLATIWSELLQVKNIGVNDNFFELGGHSLIAVQLMTFIEKTFDKRLPLAALLENATIQSLAELIGKEEFTSSYSSLVSIKPTGNKVPIYLVHGAGLHVLLFQTLAANMDGEQPIYALQARGLSDDSEPLDRIPDIAKHYIDEIIQQNPDGPYALAGYSFGGLIAFEMAHQLEAMGKEIIMLGMFDTVIRKHLAENGTSKSYYQQLGDLGKKMAWNISLISKNPIPNIKYKSHVLKRKWNRWKWNFTNNEKATAKLLETAENKDRQALIDRMNQMAFENYNITLWNGKIHLFKAKEQRFYLEDFEFLGWKPFVKDIEILEVPGDHLTLFNNENGIEFAKVLQKCLDKIIKDRKEEEGKDHKVS